MVEVTIKVDRLDGDRICVSMKSSEAFIALGECVRLVSATPLWGLLLLAEAIEYVGEGELGGIDVGEELNEAHNALYDGAMALIELRKKPPKATSSEG